MYMHASFGVLFDIILLTAPLYLIYSNMIWSAQTLRVMLIFSVGKDPIFINCFVFSAADRFTAGHTDT
jgi:hypothetical protein